MSERRKPIPLFVYGTLRSTGSHAHLLDAVAVSREPAVVTGTARSVGDYPGAVFGGDAEVAGELVWLSSSDALAALDAYEGAEFRRVQVVARRAGAAPVAAWAYEWVGELPK